jgi:hypothetical protein
MPRSHIENELRAPMSQDSSLKVRGSTKFVDPRQVLFLNLEQGVQ